MMQGFLYRRYLQAPLVIELGHSSVYLPARTQRLSEGYVDERKEEYVVAARQQEL